LYENCPVLSHVSQLSYEVCGFVIPSIAMDNVQSMQYLMSTVITWIVTICSKDAKENIEDMKINRIAT